MMVEETKQHTKKENIFMDDDEKTLKIYDSLLIWRDLHLNYFLCSLKNFQNFLWPSFSAAIKTMMKKTNPENSHKKL